jgi:Ribosome biogenesis protein SLX9
LQNPGRKIRKRTKKNLKVNLSALGNSLDEIMAEDKVVKQKKMEVGIKPKGKALKKEVERFKAIMEHPMYKASPMELIRQHVTNAWARKEGMQ